MNFDAKNYPNEDANPFDALFNNRLAHHESAVPDDMFDRIMRTRDERKRVVGFWTKKRLTSVGILALFVGTAFTSWLLTQQTAQKTLPQGVKSNSIPIAAATATEMIVPKPVLPSSPATIVQSNIQLQRLEATPSVSEALLLAPKGSKSNVLTGAKPVISKNIAVDDRQSSGNIAEDAQGNVPLASTVNPSKSVENSVNPAILENTVALQPVPKGLLKPLNLSQNTLPPALPGGTDCPTFGRRGMGKTFYLDVYGAPELAMRSMQSRSTEFENYTRARDTTEMPWYAFSAGARVSMVYKNGLALRGGIIYAQNNEIFQRDSFSVDTFDIIDRTTGLPVDSFLVQTANNRSTRYNRYRNVDLTVQVGYEMPLSRRLTMSFNGGVNFNVWESKKVAILNQGGQIINAAADREVFNRGLGISLLGSAAVYYQIADRWQIFAEPQVRFLLNPITTDRHPVRQRYTNAGLLVGLRYRF